MTNAEHFNELLKYEEETHIQAFKMIMAELQENYPQINIRWCLPKYKGIIKWLNTDVEVE